MYSRTVSLRPKTSSNSSKTSKKRSKLFTENRVPATNIVSQFLISDNSLAEFKKLVKSNPTDCVISALQIIGALDVFSSNVLRIFIKGQFLTRKGRNQFTYNEGMRLITTEEIEKIFILRYGNNFKFKTVDNYENFIGIITTELLPGNVLFCGVMNDDYTRHVFLIGRKMDGKLVFIDPHENVNQYCEIEDPECSKYFDKKLNYYILYNSDEKLTTAYLLKHKGFVM